MKKEGTPLSQNRQKLEEKPVVTVGFGHQGGRRHANATYTTQEQTKTEIKVKQKT